LPVGPSFNDKLLNVAVALMVRFGHKLDMVANWTALFIYFWAFWEAMSNSFKTIIASDFLLRPTTSAML
jgi:hypothetical protein